MRISTLQNLSAIPTSFRWLLRHRGLVLGLSLLWAALKTLAPLVQMKAGIRDTFLLTMTVDTVFTMPVVFYFLPMLLAYVDAEFNRHPANPLQDWWKTFECRWLGAAGAQVLLHACACVGFIAFFVPGLAVYLFLGWMPTFALLRGGTIAHAARWSTRIMAQEWRRVLLAALPIFGIYFVMIACLVLVLGQAIAHWGAAPTLWLRFRHPYFWLTSFFSAAVNIWLSLALLALFHRIENEAMLKAEDPDQRRK
ncbi:MAG: hypothetical protein H6Q00_601 [Holophagaceae bacterium]|nr:hypothetical protein [Holophagaceae bacterium]